MKSLNGQSDSSILDADDWNQLPEEIENIIISRESPLNSTLRQLAKSIKIYAGVSDWYIDIGIVNLYVLTSFDIISPTSNPLDGQRARFRPNVANTGASVLVLAGGTSKDLKQEDGTAVIAGDLIITADAEVRFNAAADDWFLIGA